jgi:hypothetical protein
VRGPVLQEQIEGAGESDARGGNWPGSDDRRKGAHATQPEPIRLEAAQRERPWGCLCALLRFAGFAPAFRGVGADPRIGRRVAKGVPIPPERVGIGIIQRLGIVFSPHPEVGEVVEELAEDRLAVLAICGRIEDVAVPHLVDQPTRDDHRPGSDELEGEELPVLGLKQPGTGPANRSAKPEIACQSRRRLPESNRCKRLCRLVHMRFSRIPERFLLLVGQSVGQFAPKSSGKVDGV